VTSGTNFITAAAIQPAMRSYGRTPKVKFGVNNEHLVLQICPPFRHIVVTREFEARIVVTIDSTTRRYPWFHPGGIWRAIVDQPRIYMGAAAWIIAYFLLPASLPSALREAAAWCLGGLVYLAFAAWSMKRYTVDHIKERAERQDQSGIVIFVLILLAIISSFVAIAGLLHAAKSEASETAKLSNVLIAAATIFISWSMMQVVFTFHYAHEHYAPQNVNPNKLAGLDFPKDTKPDYWDFLYFATSIGAASQTSDVTITSKRMRRLVTLHAVISFFFNAMVLALTVNLAASLI
jgi:uncharacterized membrane protein